MYTSRYIWWECWVWFLFLASNPLPLSSPYSTPLTIKVSLAPPDPEQTPPIPPLRSSTFPTCHPKKQIKLEIKIENWKLKTENWKLKIKNWKLKIHKWRKRILRWKLKVENRKFQLWKSQNEKKSQDQKWKSENKNPRLKI